MLDSYMNVEILEWILWLPEMYLDSVWEQNLEESLCIHGSDTMFFKYSVCCLLATSLVYLMIFP